MANMDSTLSQEHSMQSKELALSDDMIEVLVDGARYGDLEDVQSALQHGVKVDSADSAGRTGDNCVQQDCCSGCMLTKLVLTALHMAAANGHAHVATCLIQAGAVSWSYTATLNLTM